MKVYIFKTGCLDLPNRLECPHSALIFPLLTLIEGCGSCQEQEVCPGQQMQTKACEWADERHKEGTLIVLCGKYSGIHKKKNPSRSTLLVHSVYSVICWNYFLLNTHRGTEVNNCGAVINETARWRETWPPSDRTRVLLWLNHSVFLPFILWLSVTYAPKNAITLFLLF